MPWTQANFNTYMAHVRTANAHYERFRKSRIHTFTGLLKMKRFQDNAGQLQVIQKAWNAVPKDAQTQYDAAWQYVRQTLFPVVVAPPIVRRPRRSRTSSVTGSALPTSTARAGSTA